MNSEELIMQFDPRTIEHLGISLYSKLPTVIAELISNSWDADAENIKIDFKDETAEKEIIYADDGLGMTFDELNQKFLIIGRNRRTDDTSDETEKGRKVIGKKGLGKLSVFGICKEIEVITVKNNIKNSFIMNIDDILKSKNSEYKPSIKIKNQTVTEQSGTTIIIRQVKRKNDFLNEEIAVSLAKKFLIFDQINVEISHNGKDSIIITNEMKFEGFKNQFEWIFPNDKFVDGYKHAKNIVGKIFTLRTPVSDPEMKGVYLTSRGKIVNTASFFGLRDTDQFHTYVTGYLEVDFIDDLLDDLISTDRQSLNWETNETRELQDYLQKLIRKIGNEWRRKRGEVKKKSIKDTKNIDIDDWTAKLPTYERELGEKIINPVLHDPKIDIEESSKIIGGVIDKFQNADFRAYASHIADINKPEDIPQLLKLMEEWKVIEAKQFSDLAHTRIEVIKQFEEHIKTDTKEVPTLHNFLKKFSWLLDPRILEFKDEVRYSTILKENFPEDALNEKDRRIDFLCSNALGGILYVVEIKKSKYKLDEKAIEQAYKYGVFLKDKYSTTNSFTRVVCYVIGGEKSEDKYFRSKEDTYRNSGEVFVRTYTELLEQAKEFHKEFIQKYDEINKNK
ncbi:hypothetical protein COV13_03275 [Candidatus Woesearchaeota archaeon CG10_big_fil_rev_8_21_14_0_10_32_9]|nr:MAG: hypothetical protein COV13_03275 [Candidatus Woesearchaeota archaeon CG10_big_fil_rev_8_21_14_0_10_32_9]